MKELTELEDAFVNIGGKFYTSAFDIREKLQNIKAYLFDWDGVFNDGRLGDSALSSYSAVDSLGFTLLSFGHFLSHHQLNHLGVITGEASPHCIEWCQKQNANHLYTGVKEKNKAFEHFLDQEGLEPENVAYFFDDVLDIPIAEAAGLRFAVGRKCNPMFNDYLRHNKLVDYISGCDGQNHAVREISELLLSLLDKQYDVINHRARYDDHFRDFLEHRNQVASRSWKYQDASILPDSTFE